MNEPFELAIIGGGPAGVAAGVYASRKKLKTIFLTFSFENQSVVSEDIQNWIGTPSIKGTDFAKSLENHLRLHENESLQIKTGLKVQNVKKENDIFIIETDNGVFTSKTIIVATGSVRRKIEVPGADTFEHKGLTYCASCDGPIFSGQDVAVLGGGNAAFESAAQLAAYCKTVTILVRGDKFRADEVTVEKVLRNPHVKSVLNAKPTEVKGDKFVNAFVYENMEGEKVELPVSGIFVEIGLIPSTEFVKDLVARDAIGKIIVDSKTQKTSVSGIWAAGDCTDGLYHQNNIAAGDAVKALEDVYVTLHTK